MEQLELFKEEKTSARPILRYTGGKSKLLDFIKENMPKNVDRLIEPFIGGGAFAFNLGLKKTIINDYNYEIFNLYKSIKNNKKEMFEIHKKYTEWMYQHRKDVKSWFNGPLKEKWKDFFKQTDPENIDPENNPELAIITLFLNLLCFNGIYRIKPNENKYCSTFGHFHPKKLHFYQKISDLNNLFNLQEFEIYNADYFDLLKQKINLNENNDNLLVYLDPPYDESSPQYCVVWKNPDFHRLKECADWLNQNNIKFMISNIKTDYICNLFKDYKMAEKKYQHVNSGTKNKNVIEVLIKNYD